MSLMNFFSKDNKNNTNTSVVSEFISVDVLKTLIPIRSMSEEKLESFATDRKSEIYPAKTILFSQGELNDSAYYLLDGTVTVSDSTGKKFEVDSTTAQAKFPLCSGVKHTLTVVAKTKVSILRVSNKIMSPQSDQSQQRSQLTFPKELASNRLLQTFSQYFQEEEMVIPSLPDVAIKLRKAMQKDIGIAEAVKIVQMDPVIAAKLIQVANCPLYLAAIPAKTCFEAVNRIGLKATQNLVITLSLKQIYTSRNPLIKKMLDQIWKQSIYISCICYVLATETKIVNPEEALLAGLIADIGLIPFLNFASDLPEDYFNENDIKKALPYIRGPVGAFILKDWGFPEDLIEVPINAENWHQHSSDQLTLTDIVVLSRLHSKIGTASMTNLPAITSIPAASKLDYVQLSPQNSLHILHDAQAKINEAKLAFSN